MQHLLMVKTLTEEEFATFASEMRHGLQHLHTVGLVHRDAGQELCLCLIHMDQYGSVSPQMKELSE